jgi:hypothetical protein
MQIDPKVAEKVRALIAQRSRLTTNKVFDATDPQVKARIDEIDSELRELCGEDFLQVAELRRSA